MSCGIELAGRVDVARLGGLQDAGQVEVGELWHRVSVLLLFRAGSRHRALFETI